MLIQIKGLRQHHADMLLIPFKKAGWDWEESPFFNTIVLFKECDSFKQAITEFEKVSGFSVLDEGQCGDTIFVFQCDETKEIVSGWKALKYVYLNWYETPRECLEALNAKD